MSQSKANITEFHSRRRFVDMDNSGSSGQWWLFFVVLVFMPWRCERTDQHHDCFACKDRWWKKHYGLRQPQKDGINPAVLGSCGAIALIVRGQLKVWRPLLLWYETIPKVDKSVSWQYLRQRQKCQGYQVDIDMIAV